MAFGKEVFKSEYTEVHNQDLADEFPPMLNFGAHVVIDHFIKLFSNLKKYMSSYFWFSSATFGKKLNVSNATFALKLVLQSLASITYVGLSLS